MCELFTLKFVFSYVEEMKTRRQHCDGHAGFPGTFIKEGGE